MSRYTNPVYRYVRAPELDGAPTRKPIIVAGAGPVGLAVAIDLAQRGIPVVVLDEDDTVSVGSRAICHAKRALEILDRLGVGEAVVQRGVGWNVGKVFFRDDLVYRFELVAEPGHRRPGMVNLQQYYLEECLVERMNVLDRDAIRWKSKVVGVVPKRDAVEVRVRTPDGEYTLPCDWLIACDGARSPIRQMLGLEAEGQIFRDRFLIVDITMQSDFPTERWFWFDPPFHRGQSVLLHRQANDVWRIDFQLGWDADPEQARRPENILPRLRAMLGPQAEFEIEWASVYTFQCRRMQRFRHGRVLFAGDAAHLVSPFGARGANSGVQDADNLAWKLELVAKAQAPEHLLDTYDSERCAAAEENILASTRSTDFITPKSAMSRVFRDAVLELAMHHAFARRLVNSGRLSVPAVLHESALNTPDVEGAFPPGECVLLPGACALDAPVRGPRGDWLLEHLCNGFTLLAFDAIVPPAQARELSSAAIACHVVQVGGAKVDGIEQVEARDGLLARRYDGRAGTCYLFRPDQHVCARWRQFDVAKVQRAIARATCNA